MLEPTYQLQVLAALEAIEAHAVCIVTPLLDFCWQLFAINQLCGSCGVGTLCSCLLLFGARCNSDSSQW